MGRRIELAKQRVLEAEQCIEGWDGSGNSGGFSPTSQVRVTSDVVLEISAMRPSQTLNTSGRDTVSDESWFMLPVLPTKTAGETARRLGKARARAARGDTAPRFARDRWLPGTNLT